MIERRLHQLNRHPQNGDFGKFDAPNPTGRVNLLKPDFRGTSRTGDLGVIPELLQSTSPFTGSNPENCAYAQLSECLGWLDS